MHGDTEPLVLHHHAWNVIELLGQFSCRLGQYRDACRCLLVLVMLIVWSSQLETMTARVPDAGQANPLPHVSQVSTGQDRHRTLGAQRRQRVGRTVRQLGGVGILDDLGERAVEIEEHRGLPFADQAQGLQPVGQLGHPPVSGADHDVGQIADHRVGAAD